MGGHIHGTRVPVATMPMESKDRRGDFSHIQKDIIRKEKRWPQFCAQGFSFRKDAEATPIWPPERKVLVQEIKLYPS